MNHLRHFIFASVLLLTSIFSFSQTWPVRTTTGDYDEQILYGYQSCYEYAMPYDGNWRGYLEAIPEGDFIGFQVKTTNPLGNICYRSRVDAAPGFRSNYELARYSRRNYQIAFANQPTSPVGFRLYYTKQEVDDLISYYNSTNGTSKTYDDLLIVRYNGVNTDLDPANNSSNPADHQKLSPTITFYGTGNQYLYAEFNVSAYSEFYLALAPSKTYYVNDASPAGDLYTSAIGDNSNPGTAAAPFATINFAISVAQSGDIIYVDAGTYAENVVVSKGVTLKGRYAGSTPGNSLDRGGETILIPPVNSTTNGIVLQITSSKVTVDGFMLDGDNPGISGGVFLNGADANAAYGIANDQLQTNNITVQNNVFKNFTRYGTLFFRGSTVETSTGFLFDNNRIDNISSVVQNGRGIGVFGNCFGNYTNNRITRSVLGIFVVNGTLGSSNPLFVSNNSVESYSVGITYGTHSGTSGPWVFKNNSITTANYANWASPGANTTVNNNVGIQVNGLQASARLSIEGNNIVNTNNGITTAFVSNATGLTITGTTISDVKNIGLLVNGNTTVNALVKLENSSFLNNTVAHIVANHSTGSALPVEFSGVTVNGGLLGLAMSGNVSLPSNRLSGISFTGQTGDYIAVQRTAFNNQIIDATNISFDGLKGSDMTLSQRFATEDKIHHRIDYDNIGFVRIKSNELFVTPNSFWANINPAFGTATTAPDINRGLNAAVAGDTINVAAGTYPMADFTISKGVTILGANYHVSPNDPINRMQPNPASVAETIISGATINLSASNISLQGLTFDPGNKIAMSLNFNIIPAINYGDFLLSRNKFKINSTLSQIILIGIGNGSTAPAALINSGFSISDNRFEKNAPATGGNTFSTHLVKNININNNAFVVNGTIFRSNQSALPFGNNGVVDNIVVTNNLFDRHNNVITGGRIANAVITQNVITNCGSGLSMTNTIPESTSIDFSNNTLENTTGGTPFVIYTRSGTSLPGTSNVFKVENNTSAAVLPAFPAGQLSGFLNLSTFNTILDPTLIIQNNKLTYSGDYSQVQSHFNRPITVRGNMKNVAINSNEIVYNGGAMLPYSASSGLPENPAITVITDYANGGWMPTGAVININNNKTQGFKQSLVFYDMTTAGRDANVGYGNIPAGAAVNISNNSFTGDLISINNGSVSEMVNASCNWYGVIPSHNVSTKITETTVDHAPWLTNGTDTDVATGFQPMANVCNGVPVDADITVTNVTCNGAANGSLEILVEEGLAPFTYAWSKDDVEGFSALEDLTNLAPGEYKLIITDANGSVDEVFATITEPDVLSASATGTNNVCYDGTIGTADLTITGGTLPYTYLWSNGATTESLSDLAAGTYSVTVTDANGCTATASYVVTQPTIVTASITGSSSSCANTASVIAGGGTGAYTYLWSNGATGTSITSVPSGTYSITVTDVNGCTGSAEITLTANEAFNPSAQVTDVTCYNASNGSITVTNVNAVAPFTYSLDGLTYQASNTFNNLPAGTHTVTVVDANGCTGFVTKTIVQPPQLTVVLNTVQSTCFGTGGGAITVTAAGGTGGISNSWTGPNGFTSSQRNISNLITGSYALTVTDNNGCMASLSAFVTTYNQVTVTPVVTNIACKGQINGSISLNVTGGTGSGFTYLWSNGAVTNTISNLGVGNYNVTITDIGSGCVESRSYSISQPANVIALTATKTNATGCGAQMGTITASGTGGTAPYQYRINNDPFQSSGSFSGLRGGNYTVVVKDAGGCTLSKVINITDNGSDQYESNNTKAKAALIQVNEVISARLALSTDVADWFKFRTLPGSGSYTLSKSDHSKNLFLYDSTNSTSAIPHTSSTLLTKTYTLVANRTYYIHMSGTLSYHCVQIQMSQNLPISSARTKEEEVANADLPPAADATKLQAGVYPNPHNGIFNLVINSPESGMAVVHLFNGNGQKVVSKMVSVIKGNNTVTFTNIKESLLLYRVTVGKNSVSGRVIGGK